MKTFTKNYKNLLFICLFIISSAGLSAQTTISGHIISWEGNPVSNAAVAISGDENALVLTNGEGYYEFNTSQSSGNYIITPYGGVINPYNGISTFDVVLWSKHFNGTDLLDSPYQIIAADTDGNGVLELADSLAYRDLIMGFINSFPGPSIKFVTSDFVFPNPNDPFETAYPSAHSLNLSGVDVTNMDFVAIRTGDLNGSAVNGGIVLNPCAISCGTIKGNVRFDQNNNCLPDIPESADRLLEGWIVKAVAGSLEYFGVTDANGNYNINAFPTDYTVTVLAPNNLWSICENDQMVTVVENTESTIDFRATSEASCAVMEVDMGTPFLRRCFENTYNIDYCNHGTVTAEDAYIEVTFDSFFTVLNTSIPWTSQNENTYTFDIGDVPFNECGSIQVQVEVSCEAELGQTHCSTAQVFPDSICGPLPALWDGSNIEISGQCTEETVAFQVTNTGDPMTVPVEYLVIEDDMIMMNGDTDPIQLGAGQMRDFEFPANGSTWRMEVDQTPNHPLNAMLSAAIEGCGVNGDGTFSLGFVTQFPQYTSGPSVDIDCEENRGAFDPNDKSAIPTGHGEEHYIERNTDLEYRIRFQNTGTDTAFNIVIRDTLSPWLDPATVNPGVSSHDYRFSMLDSNILVFTYPNIMLPDSNVNEAASHGFVKFNIAQRPDNSIGTVIENKAAIYFDFNEPIITNTTFHTIGENFLDIINNIISTPDRHFDIKLYPNLISTSTVLNLEGYTLTDGTFLLYDSQGRLLRTQRFTGNSLSFYRDGLATGLYFFEIRDGGQQLSNGKLVVK